MCSGLPSPVPARLPRVTSATACAPAGAHHAARIASARVPSVKDLPRMMSSRGHILCRQPAPFAPSMAKLAVQQQRAPTHGKRNEPRPCRARRLPLQGLDEERRSRYCTGSLGARAACLARHASKRRGHCRDEKKPTASQAMTGSRIVIQPGFFSISDERARSPVASDFFLPQRIKALG